MSRTSPDMGMTLPQPLHMYELLAPLPGQGAEADVYRVRDLAGRDRVVKLYRWGFGAQREVWRKLHLLQHSALMPILKKGTIQGGRDEGRDYEVMPYLSGGTVGGLLRGGPLRSAFVVGLVNQLAGGINALHAAGIVHRDLKPANLLLEADRRHVVIADFGISRDQSLVQGTTSRTPAYAPPEVYDRTVTHAWDWWSLGMIVRQLVTGAPPFAGMSEGEIHRALLERDIDLRQMPDGPLRALCRGLLIRDPAKRWGAQQVLTWLDGESRERGPAPQADPAAASTRVDPKPPAASGPGKQSAGKAAPVKATPVKAAPVKEAPPKAGPAQVPASKAFSFAGEVHRTAAELARTLRECGTDPAKKLFGAPEPNENQRRRLKELRSWTEQLPRTADRTDMNAVYSRLLGNAPPEMKALHLLRWLEPSGHAAYRGRALTPAHLAQTCAASVRGGSPEADKLVADLIGQQMVQVLEGFAPLRRLKGVQAAHAELVKQWRVSVGRRATVPDELRDPTAPAVRAGLLLALMPWPEASKKLEELKAELSLPAGADVEWFNGLIKDLGGKGSAGEQAVRAVCTKYAVREVRQREAKKQAAAKQKQEQTAVKQKPKQKPAVPAQKPAAPKQKPAKHKQSGTTVRAPAAAKPPLPRTQRREALRRAGEWTMVWTALWAALAWLGWGWFNAHISVLLTVQILALMLVPLGVRLRTAGGLGSAYRPPLHQPLRWLHEPRKSPWRPGNRLQFAVGFVACSGALIRGAAYYEAKGTQDPFVVADVILWVAALIWLFSRDRKHLRTWDSRHPMWRPQPRRRGHKH
ncbi:serine/threonine-protein kinase [Streptomyces sp. NPDC006332]|uniref:serine/threonine-protein kinase n=1 Tax=Streptomyces sp. NPDC006332 TaxID=3155456 RepID=UPI0033A1DE78